MTSSRDCWEPDSKSKFKYKTIEGIITSAPIMNFNKIGVAHQSNTTIQVNKKNYDLLGTHYLQKGQKIKLTISLNESGNKERIDRYSILNNRGEEIFKFSYDHY